MPPVEEVLKKFEANLACESRTKIGRISFIPQLAVVCSAIVLLSLVLFFSMIYFNRDNPNTAISNPITQVSGIEEAYKKTGLNIKKPDYMINGFTDTGVYIINIQGMKPKVRQTFSNGLAQINIDKGFSNRDDKNKISNGYEKIQINSKDYYYSSSQDFSTIIWFYDKFVYEITASYNAPKEEILKIAENFL